MQSKMKIKAKVFMKAKISSENFPLQTESLLDINLFSLNLEISNFIKKINNNIFNYRWLLQGRAI
jgi:hypothetical protein